MVQGTKKNENEVQDALSVAPATGAPRGSPDPTEPQNAPDSGEKARKRARRPDRIALIIWLVAFGGLFLYLVIELIVSLFTFRGDSP